MKVPSKFLVSPFGQKSSESTRAFIAIVFTAAASCGGDTHQGLHLQLLRRGWIALGESAGEQEEEENAGLHCEVHEKSRHPVTSCKHGDAERRTGAARSKMAQRRLMLSCYSTVAIRTGGFGRCPSTRVPRKNPPQTFRQHPTGERKRESAVTPGGATNLRALAPAGRERRATLLLGLHQLGGQKHSALKADLICDGKIYLQCALVEHK